MMNFGWWIAAQILDEQRMKNPEPRVVAVTATGGIGGKKNLKPETGKVKSEKVIGPPTRFAAPA